MNPTLLKDLILAGHRVACKTHDGNRKVFFYVNGSGKFEGTGYRESIELSLHDGLTSNSLSEKVIKEDFTGEYKIVTPLPQLPQVGDTVEVLDICREIPGFDEWHEFKKNLIGKRYVVEYVDCLGHIWINDGYQFTSRQVAKCEPEKEPTPVSEETFGEIIELNGKKYREII